MQFNIYGKASWWRSGLTKRNMLIMKLMVLLLTVACLQLSAKGHAQAVSLKEESVPLKKVFEQIHQQTGYQFVYAYDLLRKARPVHIEANHMPLRKLLGICFKGQPFTYQVTNNAIIVKPRGNPLRQAASSVPIKISGKITDSTGTPLVGVTVKVKNGFAGTVTDAAGNYSISAADDAVLIVSYIGYMSSEIPVKGRAEIDVVLKPAVSLLNQLVVVGYGSLKKGDLTGAIASVSSDQLRNRPASNAMQSLSGEVAGVEIQQTQGAPGFAPTVQIRGINSISASNSPLYVIDGIPIEGSDLNMINPNDIASIEILKDASSSAIYGSRGANGVVLITTKTGQRGKTKISVSYTRSYQQVAKKVDLMNAQQFIQYYVDAHNNAWIDAGGNADDPNSARPSQYRIPPGFLSRPDTFRTTNWQDILFSTAPMDNVELSASGGDDKSTFLLSGGYLSQKGVVESSGYKRITGRINLTHKISDKVNIGAIASFSSSVNHNYGTGGKSDVVSLALQNDPIFPVWDENGNYGGLRDPDSKWFQYNQYTLQLWHPYAITRARHNSETLENLLGKAYLNYHILEGLTFKSAISATVANDRYDYFQDGDQKYGWSGILPAEGKSNTSLDQNWIFENTLSYNRSFGPHAVKALLGYTVQKDRYDANNLTSGNFPNDLVETLNAGTVISGGSSASAWSLLSYIARVNYAYENKYLMTATMRRDGSSRFGADTKWGYFPSVSAGWMISKENFMRAVKKVSTLKLRASFGVVGNDFIPDYGSIGLLGQTQYVYGNEVVQGLYTDTKPNPDLKWEKTQQFDLGLELGLYRDRIYLEGDYYKSVTRDLLLDVPVPVITGFTTQLTNIGKIQNVGMELSLKTKNLVHKLTWTTHFNISFNRNKVLKLGPNNSPIYTEEWGTFKTEVGQPLSNFFGYVFKGVYNSQDEIKASPHLASAKPGDPVVKDVNDDGMINSDDRTILGNNQPDYIFGLTNSFSYKNFHFSFLLQGSEGGEVMNAQTRFSGIYNGNRNGYGNAADYWRSPQDPGDGKTFRPSIDYDGLQTSFSSYWVESGSYVRIKFTRLSYSFPQELVSRLFLSSADIYVNAENLYTFSNYTGYDPQASIFSSGLARGVDYGSYPLMRTFSFGVNLGF